MKKLMKERDLNLFSLVDVDISAAHTKNIISTSKNPSIPISPYTGQLYDHPLGQPPVGDAGATMRGQGR